MAARWESPLERWLEAKLIDPETAKRIRAFEAERSGAGRWGWATRLALAFGVLILGAGVLLFIASHWDELSPSSRFLTVLAAVAGFHAGGALASRRSENLGTALHVVGTISLGGGIFLVGQIFNLQEHWPSGVLLWAAGAWLAWLIRRDWTHAILGALLTPAWLASEWIEATTHFSGDKWRVLYSGLLLLSITYLTAQHGEKEGYARRALAAAGGIAVIPFTFVLIFETHGYGYGGWWMRSQSIPGGLEILGWDVAMGGPLVLALVLRGRRAWANFVAALWVVALGPAAVAWTRGDTGTLLGFIWAKLGVYLLCGLASVGVAAWGVRELRAERVNLGVAGFALTLLCFYFSSVMDMLGRSTSLIGLGVLFLVGGWQLEKLRRGLVKRTKEVPS